MDWDRFFSEAKVVKLNSDGSELLSKGGFGTIRGMDTVLSATVIIDGCDSGVPNSVLNEAGRPISDVIAECAESAGNHGQFMSCVSHVTTDLMRAGVISGRDKGAIGSCAARARIP